MDRGAKFQPVHAGHADVGDDDAGKVAVDARQHAARVGEGFDRQPGEVERLEVRRAQRRVVVDEEDRLLPGEETHAGFSSRRKPAPPSGEGIRRSRPPKSAMIWLAIARPRPRPSARQVTKGGKRCGSRSSGTPGALYYQPIAPRLRVWTATRRAKLGGPRLAHGTD